MITDTEAVVLRQVKAAYGRRMILLFSRKYGKISVGSGISEGGKNKSALAIRPFTQGRYELFKSRDSYNLNNGQVIKSYYGIGENLDKYMAASYGLELTEKLLPEELAQPQIYNLLLDFLEAAEKREKKHGTLVMAYMIKLLDLLGTMPELEACVSCGCDNAKSFFSVEEGGMVCGDCAQKLRNSNKETLIYEVNFGIVDILKYFKKNPLSAFEKIALEEKTLNKIQAIMRSYLAYHLDVKELKSEEFFKGDFGDC